VYRGILSFDNGRPCRESTFAEKRKMTDKTTALSMKNICKSFGSVTAVRDMSLEIGDGEFVSLLGPSGCGKTTLLRIIAGFETPDRGEVLLDGKDIVGSPPNKRPMNMVFQRYALFPHMTVFENIAFSQFLKKRPKEEIDENVKRMLALVQLEGFETRKPDQLSGGQSQRIALARALINQPRVLLLDEPLGALDLKIRKQMQIELKKIQEKLKITFLYVTHDQEEALVMSDRIVLMKSGEAVQVDTPKRIYGNPNSRFAATFIGESNIFEAKVSQAGADDMVIDIDGVKIRTNKNTDAKPGDLVFAAIRLEKVKSVQPGRKARYDNQLAGIIEDIVFFGFIVKYYVRVTDSLVIIAEEEISEDDDAIEARGVGEKMTIGFMKKDVNIFFE
jgi:spermidine/putrescine ABC transporter ATP-binding subunit